MTSPIARFSTCSFPATSSVGASCTVYHPDTWLFTIIVSVRGFVLVTTARLYAFVDD